MKRGVHVPEYLPINARVVIERPDHPWAGHSGAVAEHIGGNAYIIHAVALDNGMRAGCRASDMRRVVPPPARKRAKRA